MLKPCAIPSLNLPILHSYQLTLSLRGAQVGTWQLTGPSWLLSLSRSRLFLENYIYRQPSLFSISAFDSIPALSYRQSILVKYSKTYHFADDTSITQSHSLPQILSKRMNKDLSNLSNWLKTNKLSLNIQIVIINL